MDFEDGGGLRRSVGVTTYPFYVPSSGGPIRARDPRCPWQGLVSRPRGVGGSESRGEGIPRHSASGSKPAGLVRPGREPGNRVGGVARRVSAEAGRARFPWLFLTGAPLNRRCWPMFLLLVVVPSANRDIFPIRSIYIYIRVNAIAYTGYGSRIEPFERFSNVWINIL